MNKTRAARAALALGIALAAPPLQAQIPAPPQSRPVALVGGTIHTVSGGVVENGTLVFDGGRITAIGVGIPVPEGAERVDLVGRHVYPGLVDGYSHMGLYEIGGFTQTIDLNELGRINPNARAAVAFNPESRHVGVARSAGVLVTVSSPEGGLISGLASAMMLEGWTWEEMTLRGVAGLVVQWPSALPAPSWPGAPQQPRRDPAARYRDDIAELRDAFATARAYRATRAAGTTAPSDSRWEAMIPVLEGRVPVIVEANELRQIQDAVAWAEEEGVRLVIRGGRDAGYLTELLASRQVPVLLTAVLDAPGRAWEGYDAMYSLPARLHAAGVRFAIAGGPTAPYAYRLPQEAGAAIAFGLPAEEALRAVTLYPARMLGIDDRVGSLEPGKDATLLVTTGDPLEYGTVVEQAYIAGRRIDMMDAQRQFYEKYRERNRQVGGGR